MASQSLDQNRVKPEIHDAPSTPSFLFGKIAPGLVILIVIVLNSLILSRLEVHLALQVALLIGVSLLTLSGLIVLGDRGELIPDLILRLIISFLTGSVIFTALNFILFHCKHRPAATIINSIFFLSFLIAGYLRRDRLRRTSRRLILSWWNMAWIIILSAILSLTTAYGFLNNPRGKASRNRIAHWSFISNPEKKIPNWGWNKDKRYWLNTFVQNLDEKGLPEDSMLHNGVQVYYLSLSRLFSSTPIVGVVKIYKGLVFIFFFSLLYLLAFIAKYFFDLGKTGVFLTIIATPFFGAVNYPFFSLGRSSYLGFFPAGASFYHSVTQLMSITIGIGGVILCLLAINQGLRLAASGSLLISGSFFFKPSFFSVVTPVLFLLIWLNKRLPLSQKIAGTTILLIPPLFWHFYPILYHIPQLDVPLGVQPFRVLFRYAAGHFPSPIVSHPLLFGTMIVIMSFSVFLPILVDLLIRAFSRRKIDPPKTPISKRNRSTVIFFSGVFIFGILSYALLVQNSPQMFHGNLSWGAAAGYLLFLPLLVKLMVEMKYTVLRIIAGGLFGLHLWGGIYHLSRFTVAGTIF